MPTHKNIHWIHWIDPNKQHNIPDQAPFDLACGLVWLGLGALCGGFWIWVVCMVW